mmetsp:Transcript_143360/g.250256  ORF Transcript_143360/g.250256 Transcript_143360/m.250256 type:complete len:85 (-) Transcript_143360:426-680(-)
MEGKGGRVVVGCGVAEATAERNADGQNAEPEAAGATQYFQMAANLNRIQGLPIYECQIVDANARSMKQIGTNFMLRMPRTSRKH